MGSAQDTLDFDREVEDGWTILVPAGTWHNVTNIGDEPPGWSVQPEVTLQDEHA